MIHTITAYTMEIDDIDLAVSEIRDQLNLDANLLKNSVGLLTCYAEFIDSGVVQALTDALPFDIVGTTTLGNGTNGAHGHMMLSLTVLTSDDISFSAAMTESLNAEQEAPLRAAYEQAAAKLPGKPSLILTYMALLYHVGGDYTIELLDKVSGGVPCFGTVTVDHTNDYHQAQTLYNGKATMDSMAFVLLSGDVDPIFFLASISEEKIVKQKAIITKSSSNVLMEVNNIPILKHLETLGISKDGKIDGANSIPFIVDFNDSSQPVARAIYALTDEGYAVCGGVMPIDSTLSVGSIDYEDVIRTTADLIERAKATGKRQGFLLFSCLSRNLALGVDTEAEMELVEEKLDYCPYQFTYSGGEICPSYDADGKIVNRFHNDTVVGCIF